MNNTNTGGPAFPGKQKALAIQTEHIGIASEYEIEHNGMTLRDYFAAKAMQAVLTSPILMAAVGSKGGSATQHTAKQSYEMADAMLKAREQ